MNREAIRIATAGALGMLAGGLAIANYFVAVGPARPEAHGIYLVRGLLWPWGILALAMAASVAWEYRTLQTTGGRTRLLMRFVLACLSLILSALAFAGYDLLLSPSRRYAWGQTHSPLSVLVVVLELLWPAPVAFGIALAISFTLSSTEQATLVPRRTIWLLEGLTVGLGTTVGLSLTILAGIFLQDRHFYPEVEFALLILPIVITPFLIACLPAFMLGAVVGNEIRIWPSARP